MRKSFKSVIAGVLTLCVAGAISAVGATSASAAVVSPFDPDPGAYGSIIFYDASGNVVTSGDATNPLSTAYAVASITPPGITNQRAGLYVFGPQPAVLPAMWGGTQTNTNTVYPIATAGTPAVITAFGTRPATAVLATSSNLYSVANTFVQNTGALANIYQIRMTNAQTTLYASTTITIDPVTKIWQQIFPVVADSTKTVLTQSGTSGGMAPQSDTLTATVSRTAGTQAPVPAGNVQFMNGTTAVGSPVAVNASGVATLPQPAVPAGTYAYGAVFTPTDPAVWITSTSAPVAFVVTAPLPFPAVALTSTSLAPNSGDLVTFTANVGPAGTQAVTVPGTVQFFNNGVSLAPAAAADVTGKATFATSALTVGSHAVSATFVPSDAVNFGGATSATLTVVVAQTALPYCDPATGSKCTDPQAFIATVPAGSIVISTPYHPFIPATAAIPAIPANLFDLGTLALNTAGTEYAVTDVPFGSAANPAAGVSITDTRAGGLGWNASLQSSNFTIASNAAAVINAGNLSFTGVTPVNISGNALGTAARPVAVIENVAFATALASNDATAYGLTNPKSFATALVGNGSVYVIGKFTLKAPSSVPAGIYAGTVTFTII
jgi:hypothetical protein